MTRARIESIVADPETAERLLAQARKHLVSAQADGVDADSAYGLCYQATLKALSAVLTRAGVRARSGAGSHVILLREAGRLLRLEPDLADRVDRMRRTRHSVFYDAEEVSSTELRSALADAATVIKAAAEALR